MTAHQSLFLLKYLCCAAVGMAAVVLLPPSFATEPLTHSTDLTEVYEFYDDPEEVLKTWKNGYVFVPGPLIGEFTYGKFGSSSIQSRLDQLPDDIRYPMVVYLHDAGGVSSKVYRLLKALEVENFSAFLPDSMARNGRQADCEGKARKPERCAMSPEVYLMRHSELVYAVREVKRLSWVDQGNVFLIGSGEGAVPLALWGGEVEVSGYILIDWTCTAPADQPWFDGLRIPRNLPTLIITTTENRWANMPGWQGSCADKASVDASFQEVVLEGNIRDIFGLPRGKRAIIEFLYDNLDKQTN